MSEEDLTKEEIDEICEDLAETARAWLKSGEDVIISFHTQALMIGIVSLDESNQPEEMVVH